MTVWQSIAQIEAVYGDQAGAILTNHPTKLIYPGMSDIRGLETASALIGREHLPGRLGTSEVRPEHASPTLVDFAPAATIRQMRPGTALMISATLPPVVIDVSAKPVLPTTPVPVVPNGEPFWMARRQAPEE